MSGELSVGAEQPPLSFALVNILLIDDLQKNKKKSTEQHEGPPSKDPSLDHMWLLCSGVTRTQPRLTALEKLDLIQRNTLLRTSGIIFFFFF